MLTECNSINEVMNSKAKHDLANALNDYSVYKEVVKLFGFREIGIRVMRGSQEVGQYASHNKEDGSIYQIVSHYNNPDITFGVQESRLLDIIHNEERYKQQFEESPLRVFAQCIADFSFQYKDLKNIVACLPKIPKLIQIARKSYSSVPTRSFPVSSDQ